MNTMATDNTAAPNRGIDDILKQTEMGSFISNNKSLFISVIVLALLSVAGFGVWTYVSGERDKKVQTELYEFSKGSLSALQSKTLPPAEFVAAFNRLSDKLGSHDAVFATGIQAALVLTEQGANEQVLAILEKIQSMASNPYQQFVV